jgi:hypothetical protein
VFNFVVAGSSHTTVLVVVVIVCEIRIFVFGNTTGSPMTAVPTSGWYGAIEE